MAINTNDVVTNIVSGIEIIKNGSVVTTCLRTGRYNDITGNDSAYTYSQSDIKLTNRFSNIAYYNNRSTVSESTTTTSAPTTTTTTTTTTTAPSSSFTGLSRQTSNFGGSIGTIPGPATWSNTNNSFTITNNPNRSPTMKFTLSGNSGPITRTGPASSENYQYGNHYYSSTNLGGGTLEKDGSYSYYAPSSLNAGNYWVHTPKNNNTNYPTNHTLTVQFTNAVLTSAKPSSKGENLYGEQSDNRKPDSDGIDYVQFTPATEFSSNGLVTNFTVYSNATGGTVFFTVPAGSARSVTISFVGVFGWANLYDSLQSVADYNNSPGWSIDEYGFNIAPPPYGASKTLTLNPGDYFISLRSASAVNGGFIGTITIT